MAEEQNGVEAVLAYHRRTKHYLHRYAASPGYLDWETQPDPFRTFRGSERIELPLLAAGLDVAYSDLYDPGAVPRAALDLESVGLLFELALGLTAWKQYKSARWALRSNPSSGNLHPTEGYAVLPKIPDLNAGVYHYVSRDHCLERRSVLGDEAEERIGSLLPPDSFLVGLSSIHWRESWKYGERAFRYCQHDAGHAMAAVRFAAASLGWTARLIPDVSDASIASALGLDHRGSFDGVDLADREHPDAILLVGGKSGTIRLREFKELRELLGGAGWVGTANPLSPGHVPWKAIDDVAEATWQEDTDTPEEPVASWPEAPSIRSEVRAARIIRQRRSAVALDGVTSISEETFYGILDRLLPRPGTPPWDLWPWPAHLHCGIFVHRVRGLAPGLYFFERNPSAHERLRSALSAEFLWTHPERCPEHLPLFRLLDGDFRPQAQTVSCRQAIAADGAFSLGMIADFEDSIRARGASWYRKLFWESGVLGQVLYLEAEAAGVRGTGIGCYFDDVFHELLGLEGDQFQSLYHFTIGGPVDDTRLMTLPPYEHLGRHGEI